MRRTILYQIIFSFLLFTGPITACKKFVAVVPPRTDLVKSTVFTNDATANSAMLDIYYDMHYQGFAAGDVFSLSFMGSLSADEQLDLTTGGLSLFTQELNKNTLTPVNIGIGNAWQKLYSWIYKSNAILEGLEKSSSVSQKLKTQLEGEAKFIRAFCHFYLVNLWGDVPLILTTNYEANSQMARIPKTEIYGQIVTDLKAAQQLLADDYSNSNNERIRPNKGAATALLARTYLYIADWEKAENTATDIINNTITYRLVTNLNNVFAKNSTEAIWQFTYPAGRVRPYEASTFYMFTVPPLYGVLRNQLVNDFEPNDDRLTKWVGIGTSNGSTVYFSAKYKRTNSLDYTTIFRLAEQYLIRAEARAQRNNISGAQMDINVIRNRANLAPTTANDKVSLLTAIEKERKLELFTEWGHRWLDLKRWNRADAVLSPLKGSAWQTMDLLYPIPEYQVLNSPVIQNPGY